MCVSGSDTYLLSLCIYVASRNMCVGRADTYLKSVGLHAEVLNKGVSNADTCLNWRLPLPNHSLLMRSLPTYFQYNNFLSLTEATDRLCMRIRR